MNFEEARICQLIERIEEAMEYRERVSVMCSDNPDISGYVTSATRESFTVVNQGKSHLVKVADVLLLDVLG